MHLSVTQLNTKVYRNLRLFYFSVSLFVDCFTVTVFILQAYLQEWPNSPEKTFLLEAFILHSGQMHCVVLV